MNKIKLFCFPYAGGSSAVYSKWKRFLRPSIELVPVELAGRGRRMQEAAYRDAEAAVDDVFRLIRSDMEGSRYALFGHSLGSKIAYNLALKIRTHQLPGPEHVFFSGRGAPHVRRQDEKNFHLMDDATFKAEVLQLGGTPPEIFEHPELMDVFLPVLRSDFRIAEQALPGGALAADPLDCSITVLLGKTDDLSAEQCDGWKIHTRKLCSMHHFEGGHFFLHDMTEPIVNLINATIGGTDVSLSPAQPGRIERRPF